MRKKVLLAVMLLLMVVCFVFVGCGNAELENAAITELRSGLEKSFSTLPSVSAFAIDNDNNTIAISVENDVATLDLTGVKPEIGEFTVMGSDGSALTQLTLAEGANVYTLSGKNGEVSVTYTLTVTRKPHVHTYGEWTTEKPATCVEEGEDRRYCSGCGEYESKTIEIDPNAHALVSFEAKAPSCTEVGWEAYEKCTLCEYTTYKEIPAAGHDWAWVQDKAPEERVPGIKHEECSVCHLKRNEDTPIDALPCSHSHTAVVYGVTQAENVTNQATLYAFTVCLDCENELSQITNVITLSSATVSYDGKSHELSVASELPIPESISVRYEGNGVVAPGEYVVTASFYEGEDVSEVTLTATLTVVKDGTYHEVIFYYEDETPAVSVAVAHGETIKEEDLPPIPEITGYEGTWLHADDAIIADTEIILGYNPINYTITYHLYKESENNADNPETYTIESPTIKLGKATSGEGFSFDAWYTTEDFVSGTRVTSITKGSTGDIVLYAKYLFYRIESAEGFEFDFEHYEHPALTCTVPSKRTTITLASSVILVSEGCTWSLSRDIEGIEIIKTKNMSLAEGHNYAYITVWFDDDHNLVYVLDVYRLGKRRYGFFANNDLIGDDFTEIEEQGMIASAPVAPDKRGYTNVGWVVREDPDTFITFPYSAFAGDIDNESQRKAHDYSKTGYVLCIDAVYVPTIYDITYHLDGGMNPTDITYVYTIESDTITLATPTKKGYTFDGWYSDKDFNSKVTAITSGSVGDVDLYAKWIYYTVTTVTNLELAGTYTRVSDYKVTVGAEVTLTAETNVGYRWMGWYIGGYCLEDGLTFTFDMPAENITVTARWAFIPYTVSYELYGGTNADVNPYSYNIEDEDIIFADATRDGYTFLGWYTDEEYTNKMETIVSGSHANVEVYAKWTPTVYTITYHMDGGTNAKVNPESYIIEDDDIIFEVPTRAGYTFDGWYTDKEYSYYDYVTGIESGSFGNVDVYAKWVYYTVTTKTNHEGAGTYTMLTEEKVTVGTEVTLTAATNPGYIWCGWYCDGDLMTEEYSLTTTFTMYASDLTYVAKWSKLTVNANKAQAGSIPVLNAAYVYGAECLLSATTNAGYTWVGWYKDGERYSLDPEIMIGMPDEDTTFTATWSKLTITANKSEAGTIPAVDSTYALGDEFSLTATTNAGYIWCGWYYEYTEDSYALVDDGAASFTIYLSDEDMHYEARWSKLTVDTNMPQAGTIPVLNGTYVAGEDHTLHVTTNHGYTFEGWYLEEELVAEEADLDIYMPDEDVTVTAKWSLNVYDVTYHLNEGTNAQANPATYTVESTEIVFADPTRKGYAFDGWYTDAEFHDAITGIAAGSYTDVEIYAKWNLNSYAITYELYGGTNAEGNPATYTVESADIVFAAPTFAGYTFDGWYTDAAFHDAITGIPTDSVGDVTVYAKWNAIIYTITYHLDGGTNTQANPATYTVESTEIIFAAPMLRGYAFDGWYTDAEFHDAITGIAAGSYTDVEIYAKWSLNSYAITYELYGGTNGENPDSYTMISDDIVFAAPTFVGYTFDGWYTDAAFHDAITGIPTDSVGDVTVYAKWNAIIYTITYHLDGGTNAQTNPATYTIESEDIVFADPTRRGGALVGWYTDAEFQDAITGIAAGSYGDVEVYAKWTLATYAITYELYGGTNAEGNPATYQVISEDIVFADATRDYYIFSGWYTDDAFLSAITGIPTDSVGDVTLYAKWTPVTYAITYNLNGGTNVQANPATYTVESTDIVFAAPMLRGYAFEGWYTDAEFQDVITGIDAGSVGDVEIFAKWTFDTYEISYELNGGTNAQANPATYQVISEDIVFADATRNYYIFSGWYTDAAFHDAITGIPTDSVGDVTLYAKWTPVTYTITYDLDGGTNAAANPATYTVESAEIVFADPTRAGYAFDGWYEDDYYSRDAYGIAAGSHGDVNVYALWHVLDYDVLYVLNEGLNAPENPVTHNVTADLALYDPYRFGYFFLGWFSDEALTMPVTVISHTICDAVTLYAGWEMDPGFAEFDATFSYSVSGRECTVSGLKKNVSDLVIPGYVTRIDSYAFNWRTFQSVTFENGLKSIGYEAFYYCSGFSTLVIPDSVTEIGSYAFHSCSGITSLTLGSGLTEIHMDAFSYCTGLTSVVIPDSVTTIGDSAFYDCSGLTSVVIPDSVTTIGNSAFSYCSGLTEISVSEENAVYHSAGNCLIRTADGVLILGCKGSVIPTDGSVTIIGNNAFSCCTGLTSVVIPDSVTEIGSYAFQSCSGITSLTLGSGVRTICDGAFQSCSGLTALVIPDSVTEIGYSAFNSCTGLTSVVIPDSVTTIGDSAFSGCSGLIEISVSEENAVYHSAGNCLIRTADGVLILGCNGSVIPTDGSVTIIDDNAFYGCSGLTSVVIPEGVTMIGSNAFQSCNGLTTVSIPDSVTYVGDSAFGDCGSLTYNGYDNARYLGNEAHPYLLLVRAKDTYITECDISSQTQLILSNAFSGCSSLTTMVIPDSVTTIGSYAFYGCTGLIAVTIGSGVTSIVDYAFYCCYNLVEVYNRSSLSIYAESWDYGCVAYYAKNVYTEVGGSKLTIEDGCILYDDGEGLSLMGYCGTATDLTLPEGVTRIESRIFYNRTDLTSVVIPDSVTSIGSYAFYGCTGLFSVTIGSGVTSIGDYAFEGCYNLVEVYNRSSLPLAENTWDYGYVAYYAKNVYTEAGGSKLTIEDGCILYDDGEGLSLMGYCGTATDLTLPEGVTCIGNNAFYNCTTLNSVVIPDSVTSIGSYAFYGCTGLISVTIGSSVSSIGSYAFECCYRLVEVYNRSSLSIYAGSSWDYGCVADYAQNVYWEDGGSRLTIEDGFILYSGSRLVGYRGTATEVTLPESVETIGSYAFYGCTGLTSVTIPASVKSIESEVFSGCTNLTAVYYQGDFASLLGISGARYIMFKNFTLYAGEAPVGRDLVIPEGVTSIGSHAFYGCTGMTSVVIPDSVTTINYYAFYGCTGLISVTIGSGVTTIGDSAFYGCTGMTSVVIPDSVTTIDYSAFQNCTNLSSLTIGSGVTSIGSYAFYHCSKLTSVTIPATLTNIDMNAFAYCSRLSTIYYQGDLAGWIAISGLQYLMGEDDEACFKTLYIGGVKVEGELVIPDGITSIGYGAFGRCKDITSVHIGNDVTSIGYGTFAYCSGLTSVEFGNDMTSIGYGAFAFCTGLQTISIPAKVTSIGYGAFLYCSGLTSVTIPASVKSIESEVFSGCTNLTAVYYQGDFASLLGISGVSNIMFRSFTLYVGDMEVGRDLVIPEGVTCIGSNAFYNCTALNSVVIPEGVTSIGSYAFEGCTGLTSVVIPDSVTTIGYSAFRNCTNLSSLTIGSGVTSVNGDLIIGCTNLHTIYYRGDMEGWFGISSAFSRLTIHYEYEDFLPSLGAPSRSLYIGGTKVEGALSIPKGYTSIPQGAFCGVTDITSISIPMTVSSIGSYAFYGCTGVTSLAISLGVNEIQSYAFYGCSGLTSLTFPKLSQLSSIGDCAFAECTGLTSVAIPATVTNIASRAFLGCSSLTEIAVKEGNSMYYSNGNCVMTNDSNTLIFGCSNSVIPEGVTSIGSYAFWNCTGLTSVVIPDSVTTIGYYAFEGCTGLETVTIPASVTFISEYAFANCSALTTVIYMGTEDSWYSRVCYNTFENAGSYTIQFMG